MTKNIIWLMLLLFLPIVFSQSISPSVTHTIKVIDNTDECLVDCYTTYEVCALTKNVDVNFDFVRNDKKVFGNTLLTNTILSSYTPNYVLTTNAKGVINPNVVNVGNCRNITVSVDKLPKQRIDNIPIVDGVRHSEFIWWNSSWNNRYQIEIENDILSDGITERLAVDDAQNTLGCAQADLDDVRITWENETYAEERPYFLWLEGTKMIAYINMTNKEGGNHYVYCNNSIVSSNNDPNATFYLYDDFSEPSVNTTRWQKYEMSKSCGTASGSSSVSISGTNLRVYATSTGGSQSCDSYGFVQQNLTNYPAISGTFYTVGEVNYISLQAVTSGLSAETGLGYTNTTNTSRKEYLYHYRSNNINTIRYYYGSNYNTTALETGTKEFLQYENGTSNYYHNGNLKISNVSDYSGPRAFQIYSGTGVGPGSAYVQIGEIQLEWIGLAKSEGNTLNVNEATLTYDSVTREGIDSDFYIFLKTTINGTNASDSDSANLTYNGITYNGSVYSNSSDSKTFKVTLKTPLVDSKTDYDFNWTYYFAGSSGIESGSQLVYPILFNCSEDLEGQEEMNITIVDELEKTPLNAKSEFIFNISSVNGTAKTFGVEYPDVNNYSICFYPNIVATIDGQIQTTKDGYVVRNLYFDDYSLQDTQSFEIPMLTIGNATSVTFNVIDEFSKPVGDVIIKIYKLDISEGEYVFIDSVKTGVGGSTVSNIVLYNEYKFELYYEGELKKTDVFTVSEISYTFKISLTDIPQLIGEYGDLEGVTYLLSYDNSTNTIYLNYTISSETILQICLKVINTTNNAFELLSTNCSTNSSNLLSYSGVNLTTDSYFAVAIAYHNVDIGDNNIYVLDSMSLLKSVYEKMKSKENVFLSALLLLVIVCIGLWSPQATILLIIAWALFVSISGLLAVGWSVFVGLIALVFIYVVMHK